MNSSIGKKVITGIAGLFLCTFLLVHLTINLLLLLNDDGATYSVAVAFMTSNIIVKVVEIFLFGVFILHILFGIILQIGNWIARPIRYVKNNHSQTSFFSKYMIHTGAIIFTFLIIHFTNFFFVRLEFVDIPKGAKDSHDFYNMVINLFNNPVYSWIYVAFMIFLGFHLHHALQSGFQTVGWNHPKYMPAIKAFSLFYSIVISVGFSIIPLYFLYFFK